MASLSQLSLADHYRSDSTEVVRDFYIPVLSKAAVRYDRAVGYFTSSALVAAAAGIDPLVRRGGRIRLVASPHLTDEDRQAIHEGYDVREIIERSLLRELSPDVDRADDALARLSYISRLIATGALDMKIAVASRHGEVSLYHEKIGVIADASGNSVAFSGSMNETPSAFFHNFESIEVFQSWLPEDTKRARRIEADFERLWEGTTPGVTIYDFPEAVRKGLRRLEEVSRSREIHRITGIGWAVTPDDVQLRDYQKQAIKEWFAAGGRGIFQMATGTGKTITALAVLDHLGRQLRGRGGSLLTVVVVPLLDLADQWVEELTRFGVVALQCQDSVKTWEAQARNMVAGLQPGAGRACVLVVTNKTFMGRAFQDLLRSVPTAIFVIADEAHHLGAEQLRAALPKHAQLRLALSATPERWFDEDGTEAIRTYFGHTLLSLGLEEAIELGALTPYRYWPVLVELTPAEAALYAELTTKIGSMLGRDKAGVKDASFRSDTALGSVLRKRANVLGHAELKIAALREQVRRRPHEQYQLVYCAEGTRPTEEGQSGDNQVEQAIHVLGNELGLRVHRYTAEEPKAVRRDLLRAFGTGTELEALVSMRCLDEGVDLPDARVAYLLASSTNPRQFIQRRGRILRRAPGKERADVVDFIAVPPRDPSLYKIEQSLFRREMERFVEFAKFAQNYGEALTELSELRDYYNLMDY